MTKMIAAACRKPGMMHCEYIGCLHQGHARIALEKPVSGRGGVAKCLVFALTLVGGSSTMLAAAAAPVADALSRPAVPTRQASQSVLLGAAQAGTRLVAVGERGIVVLSDDNGATWRQALVPVSVTLTAVRFIDATQGFAVGHGGVVLASADGGETWVKKLDGIQAAALALKAAEASGDAKTLREAERLVADGADKPLLDLHFFDARRGIVVGAFNLVFATEDGGETWQPWMDRLDNPKALHLYALRARGNTLLIAGEQGLVLRSDDAGGSFRRLATPYKGSFFTAELPSGDEIVVAGLRGNVWRSADGGANWTRAAVQMPVSFVASAQRAGRELLLANQAGMLFSVRDGLLAPLPGKPQPLLNAVLPLEDGGLLTLSLVGAIVVPAAAK
jgi:photosystem II stability/assembly factor-like uncharacterized protein